MGDRSSRAGFRAENIVVGYGGSTILDGVDLTVPRGAFTVLLGPNGSGKSTALRALAGLLPLRRGSVSLDDQPLGALSRKELARQVAVLAQGPQPPEGLRVRDLVAQGRYPHRRLLGGWSARDEAACAEAMALTATADLADRPLESLSGGQRQRAWIAMTLAQQSPTLLLDEPTTFLDPAHQIEVLALLRRLVVERATTVVAVLHDINQAARYGDHLVMIRDGRVLACGPPRAVLTPATIARVFGIASTILTDPESGAPMYVPKLDQGASTAAPQDPRVPAQG